MEDQPLPEDTHAYDNSIFGTSRIDPRPHKAASNTSFYDRTKFAVAGLLYSLRRERSVINLSFVTVTTLGLAFWLRLERVRVLIIFVSLGMVWISELLNSAVEAVVDLVTPRKRHDMAKVAKDVAAAATFVASVTAAITSMILIFPPLFKWLFDRLLSRETGSDDTQTES